MNRRLLFGGILLVGAILRFWALGSESLWHDEAWTWYLVGDSIGDLFRRVTREDAHPPLYFLVAWPWVKLGDSEAILRLPSAILGVASLPLVYRLGRAMGGLGPGLLAMAFIAVAPLHVKYSQEARSYALLFFLCTLSLTLLASIRERPRWIAIGVLSAAILYTEYLGVFFLLGEAALLAAWSRREPSVVRGWWRAVGIAALLYLPWLPFAFNHVFKVGGGFWMERTSPFVLGSEFARLFAFPYGFVDTLRTAGWAAFPAGASLLALLALAATTVARRPETRPWALAVLVPIGAMAAAGLFIPIFCARGLIYVLAPLAALAASGNFPKVLRGLAVAAILLGTLPGVRFFNRSLERENWREAVGHFRRNAAPEDPVLVHEGYLGVNVQYYLQESPRSPRQIATVGEGGMWTLEEIKDRARNHPVVWVIRRTYRERSELLELLAPNFSVQEERRWQHVAVLRLQRKIP